jgi:hypothetical protein
MIIGLGAIGLWIAFWLFIAYSGLGERGSNIGD